MVWTHGPSWTTLLPSRYAPVWVAWRYWSGFFKPWSSLWLQPRLSWLCLSVFLEVLLFCPRLTQIKSQLQGNHGRNCLYRSAVHRWMPSWLQIIHPLKFKWYAVEESKCTSIGEDFTTQIYNPDTFSSYCGCSRKEGIGLSLKLIGLLFGLGLDKVDCGADLYFPTAALRRTASSTIVLPET